MSGILDNKQRVMDTLVTLEGRRQMATGQFVIKYVSFTDGTTFYQADVVSGSDDASNRLYLEACQLPQDQITFETDDSGRLVPMPNSTGYNVFNGKIYSGSSENISFVDQGDEFASLAGVLLSSSLQNFQNLQSIGTIDPTYEDDEFKAGNKDITFYVTDKTPISDPGRQQANITHLDGFAADPRLSHLPNFKYLPPISKIDKFDHAGDPLVKQKYKISFYHPLGKIFPLTHNEVLDEIKAAIAKGNSKTVKFDPTNEKNSLHVQVFETHNNDMLKLDIIDFGTFNTGDPSKPNRRIFFVGKVYLDDYGVHTFARLFTVVFE